MNAAKRRRVQGQTWRLRRMTHVAADSRGMALLVTLFVVFALGMMLFGFMSLSLSEVGFAGFDRENTLALYLAEAGIQEGVKRLTLSGVTLGTTQFTNSLASSGVFPGSSGTVAYEAPFQNYPQIFPIRSTATFLGSQRKVRILEQISYKTGIGNNIYGKAGVSFQGDSSPISGDVFSQGQILLSQYAQTPLCATGATATNLVSPQLMAGTVIGTTGNGQNVTPPCGSPVNSSGLYTYECANQSLTEVAPTPCPGGARAVVNGYTLPFNWHPMTPIGMVAADFTAVVTASSLPSGISVVQATQNGSGVTYTPVGTYTPSYWTSVPSTNGKVMLVTATQPFCVNASAGSVTLPSPPVSGTCSAGYTYYGDPTTSTRFVDWGLVSDDLTRATALTFFEAPPCLTCSGGYQNGIRYIPIPPQFNILAFACTRNVSPGTNVFDNVTAGPTSCASPPTTTISSTNVTFTGTKAAPESLIIDNAGTAAVGITGSLPGSDSLTCGTTNFDNFNWGMILATGNVSFPNKFVLTGFVYVNGTVTNSDTTMVRGSITGTNVHSNVAFNASAGFCPGGDKLILNPIFFNFTAVSWMEVPLNQP